MGQLRKIALALVILTFLFQSCGKEKVNDVISTQLNPDSMPTMVTRNVSTVISDSGMIRYRITSKLWLIYDEAKVPTWKFPIGLYVEKFDDKFKVDSHIKCDSATYFVQEKLWRLDGMVEIKNVKKEEFLTNQLFWSQLTHKVYSDSFIHIEKSDRIIEGYGFTSNERMTTYQVNKPSAILPVDESRSGAMAE